MPYNIRHYFCPKHQDQDMDDNIFFNCEVPFDLGTKNSFFPPINHSYLKIWTLCPAKTGVYG